MRRRKDNLIYLHNNRTVRITDRQLEILKFLIDEIIFNCNTPSISEISSHFGFTNNAASDHLKSLQIHDCIKRVPGKARCIKILCLTDLGALSIE